MNDAGETRDLSGDWRGFYNYPSGHEPVPFAATLAEADGSIRGATEEIGNVGAAAGLTITAILQGTRSGFSIAWLKTYDGNFKHYNAVQYTGTLSDDGLEITGRWTVPGNWSGTFLMIRPGKQEVATRETVNASA